MRAARCPARCTTLTAARIWGIIAELAACGLVPLGDNGYHGEKHIRTPYRAEQARLAEGRQPGACPASRPGERANIQLRSWRILRKLRCCPWRAGPLAETIYVLQARETGE